MAFYNRIKSGKLAPIGTIMPWGGASQQGQSLANVPAGWIVCNLASVALNAADYPLLAATLGNEYGPFPEEGSGFVNGVNFGIVNNFPYNGDESLGHLDIFCLPNLNQLALVDIEGQRQQPNSSSLTGADKIEMGQYVGINGPDATQPPTLISSDVDITGSLLVKGVDTNIESTSIKMQGPKIELGYVSNSDSGANNGGIQLRGNTNKEILWKSSNDKWNLTHGLEFSDQNDTISINGIDVLTKDTVLGNTISAGIDINSPSTTALATEDAVDSYVTQTTATDNLKTSKEVQIHSYYMSQQWM